MHVLGVRPSPFGVDRKKSSIAFTVLDLKFRHFQSQRRSQPSVLALPERFSETVSKVHEWRGGPEAERKVKQTLYIQTTSLLSPCLPRNPCPNSGTILFIASIQAQTVENRCRVSMTAVKRSLVTQCSSTANVI